MFRKIIRNLVRIIQKILIVVSLTALYFLGFGLTVLFMMLFKRKVLSGFGRNDQTFWIEVKGYEADIEDSLRQS